MANSPDDRFYKSETLTKAFGISSIIMLIFTIWMVLDDYGRDWKGYQFEFFNLKKKKYDEQIKAAEAAVDQNKLKETEALVQKAEEDHEAKKATEASLTKERTNLKTKEKIAIERYQAAKGRWDVEKYEYEAHYGHEVAAGHDVSHNKKAAEAYARLMGNWDKVVQLRDRANAATRAVDDKDKEISDLSAAIRDAEKQVKAVRADLDRALAAKSAGELTLSKLIRSAPIVDLAAPAFKLQQIVLPTIRDDVYFAQIQKVDRCTSCHLAIDSPGFEDAPQPFRTHPKLDLMLGSRSPHPIDKIGCTVCHEGRGPASNFVRAAHTPRNEEQKKEWEKKYGWHEMHHVIEKMVPLQYVEGKCRVCHKGTEYVPKAERLTASNQLIKAAGCYGCHRIEGWDHLRKPAPSLKKVKGKLTRQWIAKWIKDPKSFNDHARMPSAFFQSNIKTDEFKAYNEAEAQAITDFIIEQSDDYTPPLRGRLGNAAKGKELVGSIGCLGCHQVDDFGRPHGRYPMAPDLSTVGSKVTADWLYSWIKNPTHYFEETTMPNLRLTDDEAANITAYLMSKRNPDFEAKDAGTSDIGVQRQVLKMYMMRDPKFAPATTERIDAELAKLDSHQVTLALGKNSLMRYGCFGCHEIKGYEKTPGIGVELTEEGSKPLNKFDFGLLHVDHSNYGWFHKKLENTRSFDEGLVKEYLDLLRMPQYGFDEKERNSLITTLMGLTNQKIDRPAAKVLNAKETMVEEGNRVIHKYNCQGCHVAEGLFVSLPEGHPQWEEHEKEKHNTEGRILSYYPEDESLGPPPIVTEGQRVHTAWVHKFLQNPASIKLRPRLQVRMPTFPFTEAELNHVVTGWGNVPNVEFPYSKTGPQPLSGERLKAAQTLFGRLQCLNCHSVQQLQMAPSQMEGSQGLAPALVHSNARLRRQWIIELLKDPQKMIPGTRMPGFWPDGNTPAPDVLGGNSQAQLEALADYVLSLGAGRAAE